ncbi:MAG: hypothetical protein WAW85_16925 [Gordonia sp. (in: high G+C Gram-positive bacteria)]|uniref:hypothetical protein n=1 Tax=Gordonia sp. (in: high G+C Gram-positive bacteria) TaxID=84139 RepID=UPI003BB70940
MTVPSTTLLAPQVETVYRPQTDTALLIGTFHDSLRRTARRVASDSTGIDTADHD